MTAQAAELGAGPDVDLPVDRNTRRVFSALVLCVVLLQRLALPLGSSQVPLTLPVVLALTVWGARRGVLRIDRDRLHLYALAMAVAALVVLVNVLRNPGSSLLSFGYLLTIYAPFVLLATTPDAVAAYTLRRFQRVMVVMAVVALLQSGSQALGVPYQDLLATVVPKPFLLQGYNTSYPIVYGSPIYKTNAVLFLEPSLLSQFLGAAIVARLWSRRSGLPLLLYATAIATTVAGTGMVLAAVGIALLALSRRRGVLRSLALPALVAIVVAAASPLGGIIAGRAGESKQQNSSANLRFQAPFQVLGGAWAKDLPTMLLGRGPGASERKVEEVTGGIALQSPVPIKLLYDYGGPAALVFLLFMTWCCLARAPSPPLAGALFTAYLILSSSLLQPTTVFALWLLTSVCPRSPDRRLAPVTQQQPQPAAPLEIILART